MHVSSLTLDAFRNLQPAQTTLSEGINIIHGHNAQGKTNFLEAIYYCATGRSPRAVNDRELIRFGADTAHARAELERSGSSRTIDAYIRLCGPRTLKNLSVDHVPLKKVNDLFGILLVVLFSPEDLRLIKAGPAERRAFMDMEICQLSPVYCHDLRAYHHALKQRNALLKTIQKEHGTPDASKTNDLLSVWDEQLCGYGRRVSAARATFITQADALAGEVHTRVTGGTETLRMTYQPHIPDPDMYADVLKRDRTRDLLTGNTASGAHKDDILFSIDGKDARVFGSQGQQRTAALSAKLAQIEIVRANTGTTPVLLLDDVLSELDGRRQSFLLSQIGALQTVITCTGVEDILNKRSLHADMQVMHMTDGALTTS